MLIFVVTWRQMLNNLRWTTQLRKLSPCQVFVRFLRKGIFQTTWKDGGRLVRVKARGYTGICNKGNLDTMVSNLAVQKSPFPGSDFYILYIAPPDGVLFCQLEIAEAFHRLPSGLLSWINKPSLHSRVSQSASPMTLLLTVSIHSQIAAHLYWVAYSTCMPKNNVFASIDGQHLIWRQNKALNDSDIADLSLSL